MLPDDVATWVERHLRTRIVGIEQVGGGCIAHASRIETETGPYFLKWSRDETASTFPAEAAGLEALRAAPSSLAVPEPVLVRAADEGRPGLLVLEWIESGPRRSGFWEAFGSGLAEMHRFSHDRYGFGSDNFIGRLPQRNEWSASWPDFFRSMRLEPQAVRARDNGRWHSEWTPPFERLMRLLDDLLPHRPPPSILHGDLWGGNFLIRSDGKAALVDPAAYHGHREADLAMTQLFGGFDGPFYDAYLEAWPVEPGYDDRRQVYNLYHLINHLNHFGSSYAGSVGRILTRF